MSDKKNTVDELDTDVAFTPEEAIEEGYNFDAYDDVDTTLELLDADQEVELTIKKAEIKEAKNGGGKYFNITAEYTENPNVDDIYFMVNIPLEDTRNDDIKKFKKQVRRMNSFKSCFGISGNLSTRDLIGATGVVIVGQEKDMHDNLRNSIKQFQTRR